MEYILAFPALFIVFLTWCFIVIVFLTWCFICNCRTFRQRTKLINLWRSDLFWEYSKEFEKVSYNEHMWYLITFRNPRKLYGPLTQSIW
jgi:hypothetical protein